MPRWLLGTFLGIITAALDYPSVSKADLSLPETWVLLGCRVIIGLIIGTPIHIRISQTHLWIRGIIISFVLSIPIAVIIPYNWQPILGLGIAYGAIIGYLIDRILPVSNPNGQKTQE